MQDALQQQQFNRTIEDIDPSLTKIEEQPLTEDYGHDLASTRAEKTGAPGPCGWHQ